MQQRLVYGAWTLGFTTLAVSFVAWFQQNGNTLSNLSVYQLFPLFGMIAFGLMWTHYIVGAARRHYKVNKKAFARYNQTTYIVVLLAILLHPGLLTWQLWRDKLGLPIDYVAADLKMYVILGQVSLLAFLAFELHRFYKDRSWWHWVERACDLAMIGILIHAYNLGAAINGSWYKFIWIFYGVTLIASLTYLTKSRHDSTGKWL